MLVDGGKIALFAIDDLRPAGRIGCRNGLLAFGTLAVPQLARIANCETRPLSFHEALPWERQIHLAVKLKFLWKNFVELARCLTAEDRFRDVIARAMDVLRHVHLGTQIMLFRTGDFLAPVPSACARFFLRQRKVFIGDRLVVTEW